MTIPPVPGSSSNDSSSSGGPEGSPQSQPAGATPVGPPPPAAPSRVSRVVRSLAGRDWIVASLTGVAGFVAAYIVAMLSLLLTALVLTVSASGSGSGATSTGGSTALPDSSSLPHVDASSVFTIIAGAPAQLVLLADLGRLRIAGSVDYISTVTGSAHLGFVPLIIALAQITAVVLLARFVRRRGLDRDQTLATSAVSGLALALTTLLFGLALGIRLPSEALAGIHRINAVTGLAIVVALVVGFAGSFLARGGWLEGVHPAATRMLGWIRTASLQFAALGIVIGLVVVIVALITQPSSAGTYPLLIGNIVAVAISFGFLGGVSTSDSVGSILSTVTGSASPSTTATVFAHSPGWYWLLVLAVLVSAFLAGLALAVRRGGPRRDVLDWIAAPVVYALAGVVLLLVGTAVFSVEVLGQGGGGSAGVTPWTVAVVAAWGAAIEAVARYVAPRVIPVLPPGSLRALAFVAGHDAAAFAPGTVPAPGTAPATATATVPDGDATGADPDTVPAGTTAATPTAAGAAESFAPAKPMSPRARKILLRSLVAAGIVVVLVVGGAITATTLRTNVYGPGPVAKAYLGDLSRGDATAASKLEGKTEAAGGMMTDAVLAKASSRITDVAIGKVTTSGDIATVAAVYSLGGKQQDATLQLTRTGTTWLFKDDWKIKPLTSTLDVQADTILATSDVTAGGTDVGSLSDDGLELTAYPGVYDLSVAGTDYFGTTAQKVTVGGSSSYGASVQFEAQATDQLTTDAEKIVTDLIDTCEKSTSGDLDSDCPFYGPGSSYTKGAAGVCLGVAFPWA